jgi:hypothetical protein
MFEPQGHLFSVSGRNRQIKDRTSGERQNRADEMQPPPAARVHGKPRICAKDARYSVISMKNPCNLSAFLCHL